jgi:hypothetical protein
VIGVGSKEGIQIGNGFSGPSCLDEHTGAGQPGGIEPRVEAKSARAGATSWCAL